MFEQQTVLDIQDSDIPKEVKKELWDHARDMECGQESHVWMSDLEEYEESMPHTVQYCKDNGVEEFMLLIWW